jgi:hypothetical protein
MLSSDALGNKNGITHIQWMLLTSARLPSTHQSYLFLIRIGLGRHKSHKVTHKMCDTREGGFPRGGCT